MFYSTFPKRFKGQNLIHTILSILSTGIHPNSLQSMLCALLSPIANIYPSGTTKSTKFTFLALFIGSVGLTYTVILLVSIINKEFELKDNKKVYVNAIVFTVIAFFVMLYAYLVLYKGVSITFKTESTRFLFK